MNTSFTHFFILWTWVLLIFFKCEHEKYHHFAAIWQFVSSYMRICSFLQCEYCERIWRFDDFLFLIFSKNSKWQQITLSKSIMQLIPKECHYCISLLPESCPDSLILTFRVLTLRWAILCSLHASQEIEMHLFPREIKFCPWQ